MVDGSLSSDVGDVVSFESLGVTTVVLNSLQATHDLFDKRSTIYSDRPRMPMITELCGWTQSLGLMHYGESWRRHRREFHQLMNYKEVVNYQPLQLKEARALVLKILQDPEEFPVHIRRTQTAVIFKVAYGIDVRDENNKFMLKIKEALEGFAEAGVPGTFLVDRLPILKYVPDWFPGAAFKRKAKIWRKQAEEMWGAPFEEAKKLISQGMHSQSMTETMLSRIPEESERGFEEEVVRNVAGIAYLAGADTTISAMETFILAMAMHPDLQKRAQQEIDSVVGPNRLPEFADFEQLPFVVAVCREVLRWQPITPLGIVHSNTEADEYRGYHIPKGSMVIGNTWAILRDEKAYPEPEVFKPDRFLDKDGKLDPNAQHPNVAAFGYGRRICPGRWFGEQSLLSMAATALAVCDIQPVKGEKLEANMLHGIVTHPAPFRCSFRERSANARLLAQEE
ncbi:cytochrome P450 [Punctularia strigosozonata HHB-11173 SS5]|uniref:Cytochrome P450 n=1 Tax=Punctularia strigosozonata (strain HHB-11173) TaxID=741275 RepID=R7S2Q4_PUNST|nr:cytochrome P450 [Punctularia strigosozonata HHB-11173 SS5]EIN04665.1 cytochrome P450 [Punctularia strigosozonata HHB-11173 SS5]